METIVNGFLSSSASISGLFISIVGGRLSTATFLLSALYTASQSSILFRFKDFLHCVSISTASKRGIASSEKLHSFQYPQLRHLQHLNN